MRYGPVLLLTGMMIVAVDSRAAAPGKRSAAPPLFEPGSTHAGFFPRIDPESAGLSRELLETMVTRGEETHSDALIVLRGENVVVDRTFGTEDGPVDLFSVTKGISSLAIGMLLDAGKIPSLDSPISTWLPSWNEGLKSRVLLRHALTHTTGIQTRFGGAGFDFMDSLGYVAGLPILHEPGTVHQYSNEGTHLLAAVVKSASGAHLDRYLEERLFTPLGITDWDWGKDERDVPLAFSSLRLRPRDFARIGNALARGGRVADRQLISAEWLEASTHPSGTPPYVIGYIWYSRHHGNVYLQTEEGLARFAAAGFPHAAALAPLTGRRLSQGEYFQTARQLLGESRWEDLVRIHMLGQRPYEVSFGRWIGFFHEGSFGQYLVVYPSTGLVVVRMRRPSQDDTEDSAGRDGFGDLLQLTDRLAVEASTSP